MLASMIAGRVFDPRRIPGLEAWWDAADSASVTLDSGRVSQLNDKSGLGRHAANTSSGSTQPTYETGARNGLNVARFVAASTQRLTVASSTATFKFIHDGTSSFIIAVCTFGTSSNPAAQFGLLGNNAGASANHGFYMGYVDSDGFNNAAQFANTRGVGGQLNSFVIANDTMTPNQVNVFECLNDADNATAGNRILMRVNGGSQIGGNAQNLSASTANASHNLQLGAWGNNTFPMTGDLCELMIFSQHPNADAQTAIRRYLGRKWGVTIP